MKNYEPQFCISAYIINLKKRNDRKEHTIREFYGRNEFSLKIIEAVEHPNGALGLWMSIQHILQNLVSEDDEFILIGEDDIEFTEYYSPDNLFAAIHEAKEKQADVLLGGISWFSEALQVSDHLFWAKDFTGTHFTVIFKKFFPALLKTSIENFNCTDFQMVSMSNNIFFVSPFLAIQKDFGYSDATEKNNVEGRVKKLFESTSKRLELLTTVRGSLDQMDSNPNEGLTAESIHDIMIPTYIINLPERQDRLVHIQKQFNGRPEFDVKVVEACKHEIGALGLWLSIRKIIDLAIKNDDDVIIICEDDHQFTSHYNKEYLFKNIIEAHYEGACFLSGGTGKIYNVVPITENRFWVGHCLSAQFVVIYKKIFQNILDEPYDETIIADIAYSRMATSKMLLYPFISTQYDFGYSDVTPVHNELKGMVTSMFNQTSLTLKAVQSAFLSYQLEEESIVKVKTV